MNQEPFTNLFTRLNRYSCKPDARPLENFCTELLAWYLRNSPTFSYAFLNAVLPAAVLPPGQPTPSLAVETQRRFKLRSNGEVHELEEEEECEGKDKSKTQIPDMILTPGQGQTDFLILVEIKVESGFGENQLQNYVAVLNGKAHEKFKKENRFMVVLTKYEADVAKAEQQVILTWSRVYQLLESTKEQNQGLQFVRDQFLEFLKEHNMEPLGLNKINSETLAGQIQGICLSEQLEKILNKARENTKLKDIFRRKKIVTEPFDERIDISINSNDGSLWIGFRLKKSPAELFLLVTRKVNGDRTDWEPQNPELKKILQKPEYVAPVTWFDFEQPALPEYDGDPEKMVKWLIDTSFVVNSAKIGRP